MKQHEKRNEENPVTNISVTNNIYTSTNDSMNIKKEKSEINDEIEESTGENGLEKYLLEKTEEHKSAIKLGKEVYRILAKEI